jgi:aryl-alcohol dehydrogenase-like predicted oxidoreductase
LGVGLVACSPLGRGFLTGTVVPEQLPDGDYRRYHPRFQPENAARNRALLSAAEQATAGSGRSIGSLALAWVLAQGEDVVPVPGTGRLAHLEANVQAAAVQLTRGQADRLAGLFPAHAVAGSRLPHRPASSPPVGQTAQAALK